MKSFTKAILICSSVAFTSMGFTAVQATDETTVTSAPSAVEGIVAQANSIESPTPTHNTDILEGPCTEHGCPAPHDENGHPVTFKKYKSAHTLKFKAQADDGIHGKNIRMSLGLGGIMVY